MQLKIQEFDSAERSEGDEESASPYPKLDKPELGAQQQTQSSKAARGQENEPNFQIQLDKSSLNKTSGKVTDGGQDVPGHANMTDQSQHQLDAGG